MVHTVTDADVLRGVRVVLVEDDPDVRDLFAGRLRRYGAAVTVATTAEDGLRAVQRVRPHVLVSDLSLPGEDGCAFIERVRALHPRDGGLTPAAAITGSSADARRLQAYRSGFEEYAKKPVEVTQLVALVANLAREAGYTG